ncbi:MAG: hypothetical protein COS29_04530 [Candidatus Omnitrophica bacterium CG02_land_8_20_14_3_00__42_8]|nr:MAG: hypothetical protein COS29_04530 [Candidatus Omnitrophica bacterium CG02_land_8_20_14_3_00__42_8]
MILNKKGVTLIEIIIAVLILSIGMAASLKLFAALDEILTTSTYYYTATNLARDVLEFGEGAKFEHPFKMWYKYPAGTKNYGWGINTSEGYALKEWWFFLPQSYIDPFEFIGDIEQKGLVPTEYPHSVEIYYEARRDSNFYNAFREDVAVTWKVKGEEIEKIEASAIPIVSNNQLQLEIQDFWWE